MGFISSFDCILDTSITWADFENQLRSSLCTNAHLGANKSVIDIGDGNGFTSRCGLITCDWIGATIGEQLPQKVVIKIPSAVPMRKMNESLRPEQRQFDEEMWKEMEEGIREVHNIEVATYDFFKNFHNLSMPRLYYGISFEENDQVDGQLCLEYVENSRMMSFYEFHTVDQVRQIARAVGKIHACSLKKVVGAPEVCSDFFERFYTHRTKAYSGMLKGIFSLDGSEKTKELMERIESILPEYYDTNLPLTIHEQMGFPPVIVNGDLRTENVLLDRDTGDLAALIDWQCTHLGVGVEDLHRISLFALAPEDRYDTCLHRNPPSSDVFWARSHANARRGNLLLVSDLLYPHCALFFAAGAVSLISNQSISEGENSKGNGIALNKVVGALEEVLELHSRNKKRPFSLPFFSFSPFRSD